MTVLSFGEVLFDLYPDHAHLGGAPLNLAAHLAAHGEQVDMLSAVGDDSLGLQALAQMAAWGIGRRYVTVNGDRPTGTCQVSLDARSVPTYRLTENVAWDAIETDGVNEPYDVLCFGTLALRKEANRAALRALLSRCRFGDVFVDINLRPPFFDEQTVRFALEQATIVKLSDEELGTVMVRCGLSEALPADEALRALAGRFPRVRLWLLTCGDKGACALEAASRRVVRTEAVPTTAVSTVGAGDSFGAAFLSWYRQGRSLETCLHHAAAVASLVVSREEAVPAYDPTCL